jgi:hypothetical protein
MWKVGWRVSSSPLLGFDVEFVRYKGVFWYHRARGLGGDGICRSTHRYLFGVFVLLFYTKSIVSCFTFLQHLDNPEFMLDLCNLSLYSLSPSKRSLVERVQEHESHMLQKDL